MGEKGLADAASSMVPTASPGVAQQAASFVARGAADFGTDVATAVKTVAVVAVAEKVVTTSRGRMHGDGTADDDAETTADGAGDVGSGAETTPPTAHNSTNGEPQA